MKIRDNLITYETFNIVHSYMCCEHLNKTVVNANNSLTDNVLAPICHIFITEYFNTRKKSVEMPMTQHKHVLSIFTQSLLTSLGSS